MDVVAELTASVWKINVRLGQSVEVDDELVILESMKMEIPVVASAPGTVSEISVQAGDQVVDGDVLLVITAN